MVVIPLVDVPVVFDGGTEDGNDFDEGEEEAEDDGEEDVVEFADVDAKLRCKGFESDVIIPCRVLMVRGIRQMNLDNVIVHK